VNAGATSWQRRASGTLASFASCLTPALVSAQTTVSSGDSLYRVELGAGPATVLVLHGGPGFAHGYLRPEWDALARRYQVVYYDQRGCGRSVRRGPYGWQQHVADLHGLVLQYRTKSPVVLAGSSWGSWLALLYAWKHPEHVSALVLSGTPPWPIPSQRRRAPLDLDSLRKHRDVWPEHLQDEWEALQAAQRKYHEAVSAWMRACKDSIEAGLLDQPTLDSATSARQASNIDRRIAARLGEGCTAASGGIYNSFRQGPTIQQLAGVGVPTLVLRGTQPNAVGDGADSLLQVLPNARLVTLFGAGHDPWFDWPGSFFAHVERFLSVALDE
jgi:proline iminopeptidase